MVRSAILIATLLVLIAAVACPVISQSTPALETFSRENVGLSHDQIDAIGSGQPVVKPLPPRTPDEVLLFGAVYIYAANENAA
jgi:hypothetical protein